MDWFEETLHDGLRLGLSIDNVLFETKTPHQNLILFENRRFGRVLALDGIIQTTERDEFIYHETLSHIPILGHGSVNKVLIVGGGDGGMLEEVLKHASVEQATLVEIDATVIDLSKTWLQSIYGGAFDDPRSRIVIADGVNYVHETDDRFDLVIVDSTDPVGPGKVLFGEYFYAGCRRVLDPGGVLAIQSGVPFLQGDELSSSVATLKRQFPDVSCFRASVPGYWGGDMVFCWAGEDAAAASPALEVLEDRFEASGIATRYYSPEVHRAAFAIPPWIEDSINSS